MVLTASADWINTTPVWAFLAFWFAGMVMMAIVWIFRSALTYQPSTLTVSETPLFPTPTASPEDLRGTAINYRVVTCQHCTAQVFTELKDFDVNFVEVKHGEQESGWASHYGRWLCAECGKRMESMVRELV